MCDSIHLTCEHLISVAWFEATESCRLVVDPVDRVRTDLAISEVDLEKLLRGGKKHISLIVHIKGPDEGVHLGLGLSTPSGANTSILLALLLLLSHSASLSRLHIDLLFSHFFVF